MATSIATPVSPFDALTEERKAALENTVSKRYDEVVSYDTWISHWQGREIAKAAIDAYAAGAL